MFPLAAAGFDQHEAFSPNNVFLAEGSSLAVFDSKIVRGSVDELECRKNFR